MLKAARGTEQLARRIAASLLERDPIERAFFAKYAEPLAIAAREVAQRLHAGGRVYAFGRGPYATDAAHVAVEFVHPVLVGKPALPAADLSLSFESSLHVVLKHNDIVLGFGPPGGDLIVTQALGAARRQGAYTFALPGPSGDFAISPGTDDEHVHQEIVELLGHMLYESVHVFLEHRVQGHDVGAAAFLYPFLGSQSQALDSVRDEVSASIALKVSDAQALRQRVAREESENIARAVGLIAQNVRQGGRLLIFGNGGSATDATDWALDCMLPPAPLRPIAALSLAAEPATISAIANDVGSEAVFSRQLIAHMCSHDVAIALSTSGGSKNVIAALEEARKRGNTTIALLGYDGGEIARRGLADCAIVVRSDYVPRVQEAQAAVYHTMRYALEWVRDDD